MVGITSTGKTFFIAHAFLYKEMEDNYEWALSKLKLLFDSHELPSVFVTDKEFACINAIRQVFPNAYRMLCTFHISKSVEQHCKKMFQSTAVWNLFIRDWSHCMMATSKKKFFRIWEEFKQDWREFPKAVDYLAHNWFGHRETFVLAWTNQIKHRNNRTTNRAEGSHGKLKRHLEFGNGSFSTVFPGMTNMLRLQFTEVEASFEKSLGSVKERHHGMCFKELRGNASLFALDVIKKEKDRSADIGLDPSVCDHVVRTVYGLPCAHELLQYGRANRPIPLDAINEHWRRLTILQNIGDEQDFFKTVEMTLLKTLFDQLTEDEKKIVLRKLKDLAMPYMASLKEPAPIIPKGRPSKRKFSQNDKKYESSTKRNLSGFEYTKTVEEQKLASIPFKLSQASKPKTQGIKRKKKIEVDRTKWEFEAYMQYIPKIIHQFIEDIKNVTGDGHCGFRCVAHHVGWHDDEQDWKMVRYDLLADLDRFKELYDAVWENWFYIDNRFRFDYFQAQSEDPQYWMVMPDAGFLIASVYNCVVVLLSTAQSLTFCPHASSPPEDGQFCILPIAHVHGNHYVIVTLKDGAPLPHIASMWSVLRTDEAAGWETLLADRLESYKEMYSALPTTRDSTIIIK